MSTKTARKMNQRIADAARIIVHELERLERKSPGECISKEKLIASALAYTDFSEYETDYHIMEAIPAPEESFILAKWSRITKYAARQMKRYIICNNPHPGVRLGTFEEYIQQQNVFLKIGIGINDYINDRTKIITEQGGKSFAVNSQVRQIGPGEPIQIDLAIEIEDEEAEADNEEAQE